MKLNYDVLKMIGQIVLPAIITCIGTIMSTLSIDCTDVVIGILTALLTCYNSVIIMWNANYYKDLAEGSVEGDL